MQSYNITGLAPYQLVTVTISITNQVGTSVNTRKIIRTNEAGTSVHLQVKYVEPFQSV